MRPCKAVVVLRRQLPLAILKLDAAGEVEDRISIGRRARTQGRLAPAGRRGPVLDGAAVNPHPEHLRHDVAQMERLRSGKVQAALPLCLHGVQEPAMVGSGPFVGRLEQDGRATLTLQIQQGRMSQLPICRSPGLALQGESQRHVPQRVLLA